MEKYLQLFTLEKDQGNHHIVIIGSKTLEEIILEQIMLKYGLP
jgi:hypothetical protein